jgi:hypothetical protein
MFPLPLAWQALLDLESIPERNSSHLFPWSWFTDIEAKLNGS